MIHFDGWIQIETFRLSKQIKSSIYTILSNFILLGHSMILCFYLYPTDLSCNFYNKQTTVNLKAYLNRKFVFPFPNFYFVYKSKIIVFRKKKFFFQLQRAEPDVQKENKMWLMCFILHHKINFCCGCLQRQCLSTQNSNRKFFISHLSALDNHWHTSWVARTRSCARSQFSRPSVSECERKVRGQHQYEKLNCD